MPCPDGDVFWPVLASFGSGSLFDSESCIPVSSLTLLTFSFDLITLLGSLRVKHDDAQQRFDIRC
jgi:hypothetical protein